MKTKIKSISEAFSMQPVTLEINPNCLPENLRDGQVTEIREEIRITDVGDHILYYIGYDKNGEMIFKYLANSCNVHYF